MSENNTSLLPDIITPVSDAIHQNLPETEKQADGALSTVVGFFNNVVLYPVKKANLTFRYKLEAFEDDLKEKIKGIPAENLQVPPTMIAGPTLEALRYTYDEAELREMFENLLASSMDNRREKQAVPSYIEAIRQMTPLDAKVLALIVDRHNVVAKCVHFRGINGAYFPSAMPYYFEENFVRLGDPFDISASFSNLIRLGLIKATEKPLTPNDYETVLNHDYINNQIDQYYPNEIKIVIEPNGVHLWLDDYGKHFVRTCLAKGV